MTTTTLNETDFGQPAPPGGVIGEARFSKGLARALACFSIGLGAAELVAPRAMARLVGLGSGKRKTGLLRAFGLREISSGLGILARPGVPWVGSRVVGDVLDAAVLLAALRARGDRRRRALVALGAVVGVGALDYYAARRLRRSETVLRSREHAGIKVRKAITINLPPEEVYRFWRDFANLPRFMRHLQSVEPIDGRQSRWTGRAPAGGTVEWRAELLEDVPNQRISWQSLEGGDVESAGSVSFAPAPGGRGTEVLVDLSYFPPAGTAGRVIARLFGEAPEQQIEADLRAFKQILETGEVVHSDASIHRGRHPARPTGEAPAIEAGIP